MYIFSSCFTFFFNWNETVITECVSGCWSGSRDGVGEGGDSKSKLEKKKRFYFKLIHREFNLCHMKEANMSTDQSLQLFVFEL